MTLLPLECMYVGWGTRNTSYIYTACLYTFIYILHFICVKIVGDSRLNSVTPYAGGSVVSAGEDLVAVLEAWRRMSRALTARHTALST